MRRDLSGAVDVERLEAFCAGDRGVVVEVLGLFAEQAQIWMRLLSDPDAPEGFQDAAHTLKGASAGIFAERLSQACGAAEAGADQGRVQREIMVERVRDALDPVLMDIAAYLHAEAIASLRG